MSFVKMVPGRATACAKALRQEHVRGTARRPMWLNWSEWGREGRDDERGSETKSYRAFLFCNATGTSDPLTPPIVSLGFLHPHFLLQTHRFYGELPQSSIALSPWIVLVWCKQTPCLLCVPLLPAELVIALERRDSRSQVDTQKQPTVSFSRLRETVFSLSLSPPPVPLPLFVLTSSFAAKTK